MAHDVKRNLLVELFVEELPPKALRALGEAFAVLPPVLDAWHRSEER
jgi:glycyl-tRNA synthetase beta subunit